MMLPPPISALTSILVVATGLAAQDSTEPRSTGPLTEVLALAPPDTSTMGRALAVLDRALADHQSGRFTAAADGYAALGELLPTLQDWVPLFRAEALAESGDTTAVDRLLGELRDDDGIRERWGWLPRARALELSDEPERAAQVARRAAERAGNDRGMALAWLRVGELAIVAGDSSEARPALLRAITVDPGSRHAGPAVDALVSLGGLSPEERYMVARVRVRQGEWRDAIDGLEAAPAIESLTPEEKASARLDLGRAYFYRRRYREAEATVTPLVGDLAASEAVAARALYFAGRSAYRQGRREGGRRTLESVAERFPSTDAARDALYLLADLDHDAGRVADAERYYARILDLAPASSTADLAAMRLGGLRYLDGDHAGAAAVFDRRREEAGSGAGRQQAAYWAGLAYDALEQADSAGARFREVYRADPLSYYGSQAAARIAAPLLDTALPAGPETPDADRLEPWLANAVARIRVHTRVPTPGSLDFELSRLKVHFAAFPGGEYALAEALIAGGLPIQGILAGREIQRDSGGWNLRLLRIVFPFPHREVIVREARRRDVNPYLAAGLIRQESMFDEDIKSRAGAIGMMQVMPATGRELARGQGIEPYSTARLTEAEVNVTLGMTFLSEMLRRYDGAVLDALVAYNAGPTRIRRWRGMPEYRDRHLFMERIPFRETRDYVKIVQANALIYATLYGCGDAGDPCADSPPAVTGLTRSTGAFEATAR